MTLCKKIPTYLQSCRRFVTVLILTMFSTWACQSVDNGLALDLPYGVQDPMLQGAGFIACQGSEIGYWNVLTREQPDKRKVLYLVLTTVDVPDPAFVICVMPPDRKIMALGPEKSL